MQFTVQYPLAHAGYSPEFLEPANIIRFVQAAESAGFGAIAFTEHPAPSQKWLQAGGHESFDLIAALAFCAAVTERLRLLSYVMVLPYRNPFMAAKSIATVDVLSGGRVTVGTGSGYLRSEFAALGVGFEERNELFDEAVEAMIGIWTTEAFKLAGRHFEALGQTAKPWPVQRPHPPLWIGGNSRRSRRRVAQYGQGWTPLQIDARAATTTRTAAITNVQELADAIADLRALVEEAGRDPATIDVQLESPDGRILQSDGSLAEHRERLEELEAAGVTWFVVDPPADGCARSIDALNRYSADVIQAR